MNLRVRNSAVLVVVVLMHLPLGFVATPRGRCRHSPHAPRSALRRDPRPTAFVTTDATGGHTASSPPHCGRCWGSCAEVCAHCVRSGEWILVACGQRFGGSALRKDPPPPPHSGEQGPFRHLRGPPLSGMSWTRARSAGSLSGRPLCLPRSAFGVPWDRSVALRLASL